LIEALITSAVILLGAEIHKAVSEISKVMSTLIAGAVGTIVFLLLFLVLSVLIKWLVICRIRPGSYPVSSWFRARVWLVDTLLLSVPTALARQSLLGPVLDMLYLRALGVSIGPEAYLTAGVIVRCGCDLITIGEEVFSGSGVVMFTHKLHNGMLTFEHISLGDGCVLGNSVILLSNSELGNDSTLGSLTVVQDFISEPDETWMGSPAICISKQRDDDEAETKALQINDHGIEDSYDEIEDRPAQKCFVTTILGIVPTLSILLMALMTVGLRILAEEGISHSGTAASLAVDVLSFVTAAFVFIPLTAVVKWVAFPRFKGRTPHFSTMFMSWSIFSELIGERILPYD
jgi:non-ribosomal peptide synthetase-like protein